VKIILVADIRPATLVRNVIVKAITSCDVVIAINASCEVRVQVCVPVVNVVAFGVLRNTTIGVLTTVRILLTFSE